MVAIVAIFSNSKRLGDTNRRLARVEGQLDRMEELLVTYGNVARIKEKLGI